MSRCPKSEISAKIWLPFLGCNFILKTRRKLTIDCNEKNLKQLTEVVRDEQTTVISEDPLFARIQYTKET